MNKHKESYGKIANRFIKSVDIYAKPIQLTYKGKEKFSTSCGGLMSLIVYIFVIGTFVYNLRDLIDRRQTLIKKNTLVSPANEYLEPENLSKKNITVAFMASDFYASKSYHDPYYGELILRQTIVTKKKNETDGSTYRDFQTLIVPYSNCEIDKNIFYDDLEELKLVGVEKYFCSDWNNLTV